ncbi:hypothetical protein [Pedobacter sp. JCM 36344]|uniref:hypothetical protein n=1 Tax=Pedobacter sp. JCM 36344 TaxID=3374280 RepID=UPI00397B4C6F
MKKRKAKRIKSTSVIDLQLDQARSDHEELKTQALIDLIVKIIVDGTLRELYSNNEPIK